MIRRTKLANARLSKRSDDGPKEEEPQQAVAANKEFLLRGLLGALRLAGDAKTKGRSKKRPSRAAA